MNEKLSFADVLATIPMNVGMTPEESMVIVLVKDARIIANLMCMLPENGMSSGHIMSVVKSLSQIEFEHFFTIAYSDRASSCNTHPPLYHTQAALSVTLTLLMGAQSLGGGLVTSEYFIDFDEEVERVEDYTRHPVSEIAESVTGVHMIAEHGVDMQRKHQPPYMPEPDSATLECRLAIDQVARELTTLEDFTDIQTSTHVAQAREMWEKCLARDFGPAAWEAIRLVGWVQETGLRDRLIVDVIKRTDDEAEFTRILTGQERVAIPKARIWAAIALLTNLLQYAKGRHRKNLLFMLAELTWFKGDSFDAIDYLQAIPEKKRQSTDDCMALYGCLTSGVIALSSTVQPTK